MGLADVKEKALTGLFWLSALMIVGVLVLIIGYIIVNGISAIDQDIKYLVRFAVLTIAIWIPISACPEDMLSWRIILRKKLKNMLAEGD
jgi:ABC-type phosphate transport system permease subunit